MMHKLISGHLTYLLPVVLSLPLTAKPVAAEIAPSTIDPSTSDRSSHFARQREDDSRRLNATNHSNEAKTLEEAGFSNQPILAVPLSISQTTDPQIPATSSDPPTPDLSVSPRFGGSFTTGPGVGYDSSFGGIEGFVPLSQIPGQTLTFLQGRVLLSTEDARLGGNLVLGYRTYNRQNNRILGGYLSYDIRDTGDSTFNQVGLGIESLGETIDFRANGYLPIGDTRQQTEDNSFNNSSFTPQAPNFQGNFLAIGILNQSTQIDRRFEAAMGGLDAEAGVKLARIGEAGALRGYGGLYYYDGAGTDGIVGVRGRLEARPTDNFQVGLSLQHDDKFGTNLVFSIAANFPGTRPRGANPQDEVVARLGDGVTRQENIVVDEQREFRVENNAITPVFATNPATNQPYLFQHVNLGVAGGNGTIETPFGTVQNALDVTRSDGNDIVYVQPGTNPGIPAFTIPDNVQVLSTGAVQVLPTVQIGNVQLPLSGAGVLPTVLPSGGNVPGVTIGNNTVLSGFAINNATNVGVGNEGSTGTGANPTSNVTIRDNQIAGSGAEGIRLSNVTGAINLSNNTITNSGVVAGGDGIRIANTSGQANVTITGNNTTGNRNTGITFLLNNTAQVTPTISGNTISDNGAQGIFISSLGGDPTNIAQLNNATISENTVSGNNSDGILLGVTANQIANNATIIGNQISNNTGAGITLFPIENAQATVTITENIISGTGAGEGIRHLIQNNAQATATISGNTISNTSVGISFDVGNNAQATTTISGNTISDNTSDGILFDLNDPADTAQLNNVRISENTIFGNGTGVNIGDRGNGISFFLGGTSSANNVTISRNQLSANNGAGIGLALRENSQASVTISANTISGNLNSGGGLLAGTGIAAGTFDNSTLRLLIDSNVINDNQASGILLSADDSSNIFSTVSNNILTNNSTNPGAGAGFGITGNFVAQSTGTNTTVCLNLANNTSINPNPAGADFNFFIDPNAQAQFLFAASGNSPGTINFLPINSPPPVDPARFTPLGNCPVP